MGRPNAVLSYAPFTHLSTTGVLLASVAYSVSPSMVNVPSCVSGLALGIVADGVIVIASLPADTNSIVNSPSSLVATHVPDVGGGVRVETFAAAPAAPPLHILPNMF